jgi:NADH:flavin oxidoreductase / NADH oxidase family
MVLQLWHVGRISHVSLQEDGQSPVSASAIRAGQTTYTENGMQRPSMPRALRADEIPGLIDDYRSAAVNAKRAGFDGVEVHSGNCYLLEQFIRDSTNKRDDAYGGTVANGIPEKIRHLVYLDSLMPQPGRSLMDTLPPEVATARRKIAQETSGGVSMPVGPPEGLRTNMGVFNAADVAWLDRRSTPHPLGSYETPLILKNPIGNNLPRTYIACTNFFGSYEDFKRMGEKSARMGLARNRHRACRPGDRA